MSETQIACKPTLISYLLSDGVQPRAQRDAEKRRRTRKRDDSKQIRLPATEFRDNTSEKDSETARQRCGKRRNDDADSTHEVCIKCLRAGLVLTFGGRNNTQEFLAQQLVTLNKIQAEEAQPAPSRSAQPNKRGSGFRRGRGRLPSVPVPPLLPK